jgi:hypothetical protein
VIAAAEAFGSGSESGHFPAMLHELSERMGALTGEAEPLEGTIVEGDRGYLSEDNLREAEEGKIEALAPARQFPSEPNPFCSA